MKKVAEIFLMVTGALLAVAGLLVLFHPGASIVTLTSVIGWVLIVVGILTVGFALSIGLLLWVAGGAVGSGILDILLGVILVRYDGTVSTVFVVFYGIMLLLIGVGSLAMVPVVKHFSPSRMWIAPLCFSIAMVALGIVAMVNTDAGALLIMIPVGLILVVVGVLEVYASTRLMKIKGTPEESSYFKDVTDSSDDFSAGT